MRTNLLNLLIGLLASSLFMQPTHAATKTWTGSVSTDWFEPANWNPAGVPGLEDAVVVASGSVVVSSNASVASLTLNGGTCAFNGPAELGALTLNNGTLTGTNRVTVTNLTWLRGTMSGSGTTLIPPAGRLELKLTTSSYLIQRTLVNAGTATWTNTFLLYGSTGAVITNLGTWEAQSDAQFYYVAPLLYPQFYNHGTFVKSGGSGVTVFNNAGFHNHGTVEVRRGTLQLTYGATHTGSFGIAAGALLHLSAGTQTWARARN